jgi:acetylornithine/N-succinyldiaminopimelate aminotransferase
MAIARDEQHLLIAGGGDNCVRILPPLNMTIEEAREAIQKFEGACEFVRSKTRATA